MKLRQKPDMVTAQQTPYGVQILLGLNRTGRHIYEGTVPAATVQRRRTRNKAARKARRSHR